MKQEKKDGLDTTLVGQPIKIAIISDPHLYAPELGTTGIKFEQYLKSQCYKMEVASEAILQSALDIICKSDAQVVLIPGDMTNNGELLSHKCMVRHLDRLIQCGKQVVVINGNHDVLNPDARRYGGDNEERVENITPEEFKKMYSSFGYDQAHAEDPKSLSYTIDLSADVRLIVIDSCQYDARNLHHITPGEVSGAKLEWVKEQIHDATVQGKTVLGMMHHGIVPHFITQTTMFPGFVVNDYVALQEEFSSLGLQVMFTGHFHSQDLSGQYFDNNRYMLEIETGSLVNYPVPIRFLELTGDRQQLNITSQRVKDINCYLQGAGNFTDYAQSKMAYGGEEMFLQQATFLYMNELQKYKPELTDEEAKTLGKDLAMELAAKKIGPTFTVGDLFKEAGRAHYPGDEKIDSTTKSLMQCVADSEKDVVSKLVGINMLAMATDMPPVDNNVKINLQTGKAIE